jgi:hypothetical protein
MADESADLANNVKKWLNKSGYPLEMEIAQCLQKSGFGVNQSEFFEDSESGKWRETDVVAYAEHRSLSCQATFALIAECKGGKDKPWVLFSSKDNYPESLSVARRASSDKGESILNLLALNEKIKKSPLFALPERPGYSLAVALKDDGNNIDVAFKALNSVLKATIGLVNRLDNLNIIPFVWPTIVINAPLFESYLDDEGNLQVHEIQKGLLIWKNPMINNHTLVDIYTKDQFIAESKKIHTNAIDFLKLAVQENDRWPRTKKKGDSEPKKS